MNEKLMVLTEVLNDEKVYIDPYVLQGCSSEELEMATDLYVEHLLKGKKTVAVFFNYIQGYRMISFVVKGEKATHSLRRGYILAYAVNVDIPHFSEWGEILIATVQKDNKIFERIV